MVTIAKPPESAPAETTRANITTKLASFEQISLEEIAVAELQDRFDSKFLFGLDQLPELLDALAPKYRVLEIDGVRAHRYQTLYFDTPAFALYRAQHSGRPVRYKVRSRRYVETMQCYFEIKRKDGKARTLKRRMPTSSLLVELDGDAAAFVDELAPYPAASLEPKLWSRFTRITLVSRGGTERATLDLDLAYSEEHTPVALPGVVVAELKQAVVDRGSGFWQEMRRRSIHQTGFSKYCIGAAMLNSGLKHNRFKPELLRAARISEVYRLT